MKIKKEINVLIFVMFVGCGNLFAQSAFQILANLAIENNIDIKKAEATYESAQISAKTLNGFYAPGISITSSTSFDKDYKLKTNPQNFSSNVTVTQQIPGGFALSTTGAYAFTTWEDSVRKMQQTPGISFTLANSLYPYWAQGMLCNPAIMSLKQKKEYCYNQLLSTKKEVLESLIQNYAMAVSYKKSIQIYENSIWLIQNQIDALKELHKTGNTNQAKITELENSKWSYQQDLISAMANYEGYLQTLKNLCGTEFDEQLIENEREIVKEVTKLICNYVDNVKDPYEKNLILQMEMLETERVQQKVNNAPSISLTVTPAWSLNATDESEWKKAWKQNDAFSNWTASVGIDFSNMISGLSSKAGKQAEIEYETAERTYEAYLCQRAFVKNQYGTLLSSYFEQLEIISNVLGSGEVELNDLKVQLEAGAVSSLDYYAKEINVKNMRLSKESVEINCWMYEILAELK